MSKGGRLDAVIFSLTGVGCATESLGNFVKCGDLVDLEAGVAPEKGTLSLGKHVLFFGVAAPVGVDAATDGVGFVMIFSVFSMSNDPLDD